MASITRLRPLYCHSISSANVQVLFWKKRNIWPRTVGTKFYITVQNLHLQYCASTGIWIMECFKISFFCRILTENDFENHTQFHQISPKIWKFPWMWKHCLFAQLAAMESAEVWSEICQNTTPKLLKKVELWRWESLCTNVVAIAKNWSEFLPIWSVLQSFPVKITKFHMTTSYYACLHLNTDPVLHYDIKKDDIRLSECRQDEQCPVPY